MEAKEQIIQKVFEFTGRYISSREAEQLAQEGRREVVEWLNKEDTLKLKSLQNTPDWFKHCGLLISDERWQAKFQEWGIKEG